jgi:hypothetical protein
MSDQIETSDVNDERFSSVANESLHRNAVEFAERTREPLDDAR